MNKIILFDLSGTLVSMRPPKLKVEKDNLAYLSSKFTLGIVTGAKKSETINILKKLEIYSLFSIVITKDDTPYKKPNKNILNTLNKGVVWMFVGDRVTDYQLAQNSGIRFCFVGKKEIGEFQSIDINQIIKYIQKEMLQ